MTSDSKSLTKKEAEYIYSCMFQVDSFPDDPEHEIHKSSMHKLALIIAKAPESET